jgi:hypothetical protein
MTTIQPTAHTIGNALTEAEAAIRERLAVLEASAKTDEGKIVTWVKTNWAHFVTWAALAAPIVIKHL